MTDPQPHDIVTIRGSTVRLADGGESDPIVAEVIRHGLNGAAERMMITLRRAAFSPLIYEAIDFACGLFDSEIRLLSQCRSIPQFLGTLSYCVEAAVSAVGGPDSIEPGDVIWSTDGYANGSHSQDAVIVVPAFVSGSVVAYAAVKAHQLDIAAKHPFCTDTVDNFQEGVNFPGVRLWRRGVLQRDMWRTLVANSRMPKTLAGDVQAQVAAANAGIEALHHLMERHGAGVFWPAVERMFDHGESVMRNYIESIPDGRYVARSAMDNNGVTEEPVPFEIAIDVSGGDIVVDFSNSAAEQGGPINCPLATTVSTARLAIMALIGGAEDLPNEGHFRPIEIRARVGTIFCPRPPAPIFLYGWTGDHATEVIHLALAEALPTGVPAGSGGTLPGCSFYGNRADGTFWHDGGNIHVVGQGATYDGDATGPLTIISCSGTRNVPAEVVETRYPIMVDQFELAQDSCGAGRYRGGLGIDAQYRMMEDAFLICVFERTVTPGWGLFGGQSGRPNKLRVTLPDGSVMHFGKVTGLRLPIGTTVLCQTGGGGGYGEASERTLAALEADVHEEYVSRDYTRREHGYTVA